MGGGYQVFQRVITRRLDLDKGEGIFKDKDTRLLNVDCMTPTLLLEQDIYKCPTSLHINSLLLFILNKGATY